MNKKTLFPFLTLVVLLIFNTPQKAQSNPGTTQTTQPAPATCGNDKKQFDALAKETETILYEAMKDLADMNRMQRKLKESLIASTMTPEQSATYVEALTNMCNAENQLMEWMKSYKRLDEMKPEEALKNLQEQKTLIEKSHAEIKTALAAGLKLPGN